MRTSNTPVPPHDPQAAEALALMGEWGSFEETNIVQLLRQASLATHQENEAIGGDRYIVAEYSVPTLDGGQIPILVCQPLNTSGHTPVLYWIHGGGMVSGTHRDGIQQILDLAEPHGAAVVSIGYRLAPEHPHPTPVEDCFAGLSWTRENAATFGFDPARLVVIGSSAGGGLAAGLSLLSRDRHGPAILGQILMQPMLDDRNNTPSAVQLAEWATWNRQANLAGWDALLGPDRGAPHVSPYAAPARAADVSSLPPTFIDVGSTDLFRDEAVSFASKLWLAGGIAELHVWPGGYHGYESLAPGSAMAISTSTARKGWLDRLLTSLF